MKQTIEWATPKKDGFKALENTGRESKFTDHSFIPAARERKARLNSGVTWLRILPAIKGGENRGVLYPVETYEAGFNKWIKPEVGRDIVTDVRVKMYEKNRAALYSKANPNGIKLWGKPTGLAWAIDENAPKGKRLVLLALSMYDGQRGGSAGVGFQLCTAAAEKDNEPGSKTMGQPIHGDITDPEAGRLVKITKTTGGEYAQYTAAIGKNPAPIADYMAMLTEEELALIVPLESVINPVGEQDVINWLRAYMGPDFPEEVLEPRKPREQQWADVKAAGKAQELLDAAKAATQDEIPM